MDYGLSFNEEQGDVTLTNETIGNRFLALPEGNVVGENRRDLRSELTLLCGILHYCLTAMEPRQLQDSQGRLPHRRIGLGNNSDDPRVPRLELFFDRGFFPHINNRFQTIQEFKTELDQLMSSEEQASIEDPTKTAKRVSRKLFETNRHLQLESFKPHANNLLSNVLSYVNTIRADMGEFELSTHWHSAHVRLPPDLEQLSNVNAGAIHVKVKLHPQRRGVLYAVGIRGMNLVVCRTELIPDESGGLTSGVDWDEVCTYPAGQAIDPTVAIQDAKRFINGAVEELGELISGGG